MLVGQSIGPFRITKELGAGAMGSVYLADYNNDRQVALKMIALGLSDNPTALARFEREGEILKQLKHPNIVRLFATGRWRKTPFLAMEYVEGDSLDRILVQRGKLDWREVIGLGVQLCNALTCAHQHGIIHRDLKPSNLILTADGTLKLADFGIAKDTDVTALTGMNSTVGTAAYMSPEQCKGERDLTPKSDLYSMGVVLYELVTGRKPFESDNVMDLFMKHVKGPFVRPARLTPELPSWFDTLIRHLLEKKPESRPRDAEAVARALADIETKVNEMRSIGDERAVARKVDRKRTDVPLDQADRTAAKALLAGKRLRPVEEAPSKLGLKIGAAIVGIAILVGAGYLGRSLMRGPTPEALFADIEATKTPEGRRNAIARYLAKFAGRDDDLTKRVVLMERDEKSKRREEVLLNRFGTALRNNPESDDDPEAYRDAMTALAAESDGDLALARKLWQKSRDTFAAAGDDAKRLWHFHALRKLAALDELAARLKRLNDELTQAELEDRDVPMSVDVEGRMRVALRFERFGDFARAYDGWKRLADDNRSNKEHRADFLLAANEARRLAPQSTKPTQSELLSRIESVFTESMAAFADPDARLPRRNARTQLRAIRDLYAEISGFQTAAKRAKELLAKNLT